MCISKIRSYSYDINSNDVEKHNLLIIKLLLLQNIALQFRRSFRISINLGFDISLFIFCNKERHEKDKIKFKSKKSRAFQQRQPSLLVSNYRNLYCIQP